MRCGEVPNSAAAPATVSGEFFVLCHWGSRSWEGDERYRPASQETCRQPWSHAKMSVGEYSISFTWVRKRMVRLVRCDVPLTSYRGPNHVFHPPSHTAAPLSARLQRPGTHCSTRHVRREGTAGRAGSIAADRRHLTHDPTRTRAKPTTMKDRCRAVLCRPLRRRPARAPQRGPARTPHRTFRLRRGEAAASNFPASSEHRRPLLPPKRSRIRRPRHCQRSSRRCRACS